MKKATTLLLFLLVLMSSVVVAQSTQGLNQQDLSRVDVEELSDNQLRQYAQRAEQSGLTQQQVEQQLRQRGMSASQISQLRERLRNLDAQQRRTDRETDQRQRDRTEMRRDEQRDMERFEGMDFFKADSIRKIERQIFGYELFSSAELTFEPSLRIPTPPNYQLGPGDELVIDIWGAAQMNYRLEVSEEGNINIENIGPIYVNGLEMREARQRIKDRLASIYSGLRARDGREPNTFASVSLGQVRSIQVSIIGEIKHPGTYTLPSLATVFNALYLSGGPSVNGSFREIQIIRGDEIAATMDLYDVLIHGNQISNIRLRDQDIIKVNPYQNRISVSGEVKRKGLFEVTNEETLSDLILFTGEFTGKAYQEYIKVYRNTPRERSIRDVAQSEFDEFHMQNGDSVVVGRILDRFANRVQVRGAVFRPGDFELRENETLSSLIQRAEGLRGDAFLNRVNIIRMRDNFEQEMIAVDLRRVLDNPEQYDIELRRDDIIQIASIFDLREEFRVHIFGPVQMPDEFEYYEDMTLQDLIKQAGGFKERASEARIEIARRISDADPLSPTSQVSEIFYFNINRDLTLSDEGNDFILKPFDHVYVRTSPGYQVQRNVEVRGEVLYAGKYSLAQKTERISDLVERAGGLTADAYPEGATLIRRLDPDANGQEDEDETLEEDEIDFFDEISDESLVVERRTEFTRIGINLERILDNPGSKYDLILREGDRLEIPIELQTVRLSGAVFQQVDARYDSNYSFRDYINQAGGYANNAMIKRSYVIYANGSIDRTRSFLGIRSYPEIRPGAEIVVPEKPERQPMSTGERISIASTIVSMAAIVSNTIYQLSR